MQETQIQSLGWEDPLEKERATLIATAWPAFVPNLIQHTFITRMGYIHLFITAVFKGKSL